MSNLDQKINQIKRDLEQQLLKTKDLKILDALRIYFLGKKGLITALMSELKNLSPEKKRQLGPSLNILKKETEEKIQKTKEKIIQEQTKATSLKKVNFDVTAYKTDTLKGNTHVYTKFIEEIENIFLSIGFDPYDGPEVESDYYNFTSLNVPQNHPARDMYDTFWLNKPSPTDSTKATTAEKLPTSLKLRRTSRPTSKKNLLLRTHTSPVQMRIMENNKPPISAFVIGRAFRHEATDATHDFTFMQCEGLLIDKNVTLSNLFAVSKKILQTMFQKKELDIRIRPGFFPFVEPGVEIDMRCPFCSGGCSVCKKTTWLEVFPGGLVHPNVLKFGGIDPEKYSGFAFGFGLTRLAMLKYGINDIRLFHSGKLKFLEQF